MSELSSRQKTILAYIERFVGDSGYPPTVRDIQNGCGISSTSVVDYNLKALVRDGLIRRRPDISRGIELASRQAGLREIPLIGQIAAGKPIPVPDSEAWDITAGAETLAVARDLTRSQADLYALRVKGLSMVDALINDGDVVVMQYTNSVENGDMAAVWLKSEKETTLKKVYYEKNRVRLQPANAQMQPFYVRPDNIEIQGKVIAVIRTLEAK
ncbi:MAG: repressor LexA [Chloroflexi bacterium]|nr:repressor LexA [Chloroflexota bacterium]